MKRKSLLLAISLVLAAMVAVGGTLAWLADKSDQVVNTFTYGDVNIDLEETDTNLDSDESEDTNTYKMVPGNQIAKDPKVTVLPKSETCWLFVEVVKSDNFDKFLTYGVRSGWTELSAGVYYRSVDSATENSGVSYFVLSEGTLDSDFENGFVTVKSDVKKSELEDLGTNLPTLTFNAYAVQKENVATVEAAWAIAKDPTNY